MRKSITTSREFANVFYFGRNSRLLKWCDSRSIEKEYWSAVLRNFPPWYQVIVTENPEYLPCYGDEIVVILKSDEFCSDIAYADRVKATFRNYFCEKYRTVSNIFTLPLPYLGTLGKQSIIPVRSRSTDVFFAGQVKYPERKKLAEIVVQMKKQNGRLKIEFQEGHDFLGNLEAREYFAKLRDSKISLCPRGASNETYRHIESLRHGCVSVSLPFTDAWYFKAAPFVTIGNWDELPSTIERLLNDEQLLDRISANSWSYWEEELHPDAIASFMIKCLNSVPGNL